MNALNDKRFANEWMRIRILRCSEGRRLLHAKLVQKGVSKSIILDVLNKFLTIENQKLSLEKAYNKIYKPGLSEAKLISKLQYRGFSYKEIREMINDENMIT